METQRQMVSYEDTEEADGLEEYYGKIEDEMPPQESKSVTETPQDLEDGDYSDLKENRKDRDKKHSRSHHRSRNHKKLKNHDHSDDQEQKPSKKAKKEEQILQDQTVQKNSPKLGEPLIGEDGEILEDGEIADDQEGAFKDDDEGEVEDDGDEALEKDKEESKDNNETDTSDRHDKKDKRKRQRDRHRDQSAKRRRSKEENDKEKQKKKKRHHNYKDYDKVEDDFSQSWMPSKDDKDRHRDRSPLSPYNSQDEDQEFGSPNRGDRGGDRGDRDQRRRMSGDRSERRFNNSRGNRNRGRGGRNNRGRDRDRDRGRDRDRSDRDKDRGGSKRRNSGEGYRSPPGPYDSPSDDEYGSDSRGGRKPKTMMSMVEGEYLDPSMTTNENERLQHNKSKKKQKRDAYRERREREKENEEDQPVKKKPLLQTPMEERPQCRFYREGKCHKGDDCPFNHDFNPDRKLELCRFYLVSHNCRNRDSCLYMHEDFPCKYFHTDRECYSGDNCRFSHDPLTEETEQALNNLMDGNLGGEEEEDYDERRRKRPSLLGSPPREQEEWVKERMKGIPSLFDIETFPPGHSPKKPPSSSSQSQSSPPIQRPQGFYSEANMSPQTGPNNQMRFNGPNQGNSPRPPFMPGQQGPGMPFPGSDMQGPPGGMQGPGMQGVPMGPPPPMNQAAALVGAILRAAPMLQQQLRGPGPQGPPNPMGQQGPPTSGPGGMMMMGPGMQGPGDMMMGQGQNMMGPGPNMMGPPPMPGNMDNQGFMGHQDNSLMGQGNMGMGQNFGMDSNSMNQDPNNMNQDRNNMNNNPMDPRYAMTESANLDNQDMEIENQTDTKEVEMEGASEAEMETDQKAGKSDMGDVDLRTDVDMRGDRNEERKEETKHEAKDEEEARQESKPEDLGFEIPAHLPKKQREMFIRIQQQQIKEREKAEKEKAKEAQEKPQIKDEDNWSYSSDEEEDEKKPVISNILNSLSTQSTTKEATEASRSPISSGSSSLDIMQMINAIKSQSTSRPTDPRQRPDSTKPPQVPVSHPEPTIIHSREGDCPYRLIKVLYIKQRIPTNITLSDSTFKNDPRVQKMLRQQELESGIVIDHSATTVKPTDPRAKSEPSKGLVEPKFPLLESVKKEPSLPRPELSPFVDPRSKPELTPFVDPRLMKSENSDPRLKSEKPQDPRIKNVTDLGNMGSKPIDPRLQRMQSNQGVATHNMPGMHTGLPGMHTGLPGMHSGMHNLPVRPMDPRLARQDSNSSVSNRPMDPRLSRQNSRDTTSLGNGPSDPRLSKQTSSESVGDPRFLGRQTSDPRLSSLENSSSESGISSKPMDPRLGRVTDQDIGPPSIQRQFSQPSTTAEKVNAETKSEPKPKLDYRNDPRFKRKPISGSNLSSPSGKSPTASALRKTTTEYSSPLSGENKSDDESGYNSYNKPRPKGSGAPSVSSPKLKITPDMVPKASEDITTHDILDSLKILSPPVVEEPAQSDKHLKDLFKTIDPTASPFC